MICDASDLSIFLSTLVIIYLLDYGYLIECQVVSHCDFCVHLQLVAFDSHFTTNQRHGASSHPFINLLYIFLGECLFKSFAHFLLE